MQEKRNPNRRERSGFGMKESIQWNYGILTGFIIKEDG